MNILIGICLGLLGFQAGPSAEEEESAGEILKKLADRVTLSGQWRFRAEYRDPLGYATAAAMEDDEDFALSRIRLNLDIRVSDEIDLFFQPQDSRTFGDAGVIPASDAFDFHQGYAEFHDFCEEPVRVRIGRQALSYGKQRLVSPLDWHVVGRAWDGVTVRYGEEDAWVEGFYTVVAEGAGGDAENDADFGGLYASYGGYERHRLDAFLFRRRIADNSLDDELGNTGTLSDYTIGSEIGGAADAFDYSILGAWQFGDRVETDVSAWAFVLTAGWTFDAECKPRVGIEYTAASGDEDPTDGDEGTFDPLYPFAHAYQGYADVFAFRNGHDLALKLKAKACENATIHLDFHNYWLDEEKDAWFGASGAAIRQDATGNSDDRVGSEINLHVKATVLEHVKVWAGWAHFFAGEYVEDTGDDDDMDWFFVQGTIDF